MNILLVSQHYYPENFRINDIAEELVKRGNQVTVLCGYPNYQTGYIYDGYKGKDGKKHKQEIVNGVKIIRSYEHPRKKGAFNLFLNFYSVALSMKRTAKKLKGNFDCVLINQLTPVMQAWSGLWYARKHKIPAILYCYDLWPDSLVAGGIKHNSIIFKYFYRVSNRIYKKATKILVTSKNFIDYFRKIHKINDKEILYLPQYCEDMFSDIKTIPNNSGMYNYVFAGNVGNVQSVETIIKAANLVKDDKSIKIHIVGDGSKLGDCEKMCKELKLDNVVFYGKRPLEEMNKFYEMASAMIVTLSKDEIISKTLPGKVQSYMAAGKPIIASIDGEANEIICEAKCGLVCNSEDFETLADLFIKMKTCDVDQMSKNSKKYYLDNFNKELFFEKLLKYMEE